MTVFQQINSNWTLGFLEFGEFKTGKLGNSKYQFLNKLPERWPRLVSRCSAGISNIYSYLKKLGLKGTISDFF